MEANKYAFRSTVHLCEDPDSKGYVSGCDKVGSDIVDQHDWGFQFGSDDAIIDTDLPFHVKIKFYKKNSTDDELDYYKVDFV